MPITPSQWTLAGSFTSYAALLRLLSGPSPSAVHFSKSTKTISTLHSSLVTILALIALRRHSQWHAAKPPSKLLERSKDGYPDDSHNPFIAARSEFANCITALEAGYLMHDSIALILEAHLHGGSKSLDKTLLTHHAGIGGALLVLHYYIARGRDAGIYVIVMFLLMNASTPILNLRWYLRTFHRSRRRMLVAVDLAFVVSFFFARVWLVWRILAKYGAYHGWTAVEAYRYGLRWPCKLGTGALWAANLSWWITLVMRVVGMRSRPTLSRE
ncbi:MAG: hypothetical protein Q9225_001751 [Loekoesia sp. 1 TL-2023]